MQGQLGSHSEAMSSSCLILEVVRVCILPRCNSCPTWLIHVENPERPVQREKDDAFSVLSRNRRCLGLVNRRLTGIKTRSLQVCSKKRCQALSAWSWQTLPGTSTWSCPLPGRGWCERRQANQHCGLLTCHILSGLTVFAQGAAVSTLKMWLIEQGLGTRHVRLFSTCEHCQPSDSAFALLSCN